MIRVTLPVGVVAMGGLVLSALQPQELVAVDPVFGIAGHYGTWTVTYTVGSGGIGPGGAVRVQLPDTWHAGERNSANRLQASDPTDDYYVFASGSGTDVRLETEVESETAEFLVKSARPGLDGRAERYVFVVRATVVSGAVRAGETVKIVYGDTSRGSRGMRAAIVATGPEPILVSVDRDGRGNFEPVMHEATITSRSGIINIKYRPLFIFSIIGGQIKTIFMGRGIFTNYCINNLPSWEIVLAISHIGK